MLDYFAVFSKGGVLLWAWQLTALRGWPVDALVRTCLLEEHTGERAFAYTPPGGSPAYTLKWALHNGLGLVFVAVYQRALKLLYVDELLERVRAEFTERHYKPRTYAYDKWEPRFRQLLAEAEAAADAARRPAQAPAVKGAQQRKGGDRRSSANGTGHKEASQKSTDDEDGGDADGDGSSDGAAHAHNNQNGSANGHTEVAGDSGDNSEGPADKAFDTSVLSKLAKRVPGAPKAAKAKGPDKDKLKKKASDKKAKVARKWDNSKDVDNLDFSEKQEGGAPAGGASEDSGAEAAAGLGRSLVDVDEDEFDSDEEELEEEQAAAPGAAGSGKAGARGGLLASFSALVRNNLTGTAALSEEDIAPALDALRRKLMERNVAQEIAAKLCDSVAAGLVGRPLGSFTRVASTVREALEAALTRILTPKRSIDLLRDVRAAQARGKPYVITFVGVNGVGKSTNLAKVAYWLQQQGLTVQIAACDTFRSGAVEQLRTHCRRLNIPLYERGYEKDPAKVAFEAVKAAERAKIDIVLVDTAGRMQDNEPLMRALANLINLNQPDLVLFVGEALVGNDGVDQLTKFNQRLSDLAVQRDKTTAIDALLVTKFDTVDDKVGAIISMVYISGAPVMFVGCGQTYVDLKRLSIKQVVRSLLK